jgi:hypothetical protein
MDQKLGFEYVTSLDELKSQMSDGKAGLDMKFNFNTGDDPGRKYFLQAMKK